MDVSIACCPRPHKSVRHGHSSTNSVRGAHPASYRTSLWQRGLMTWTFHSDPKFALPTRTSCTHQLCALIANACALFTAESSGSGSGNNSLPGFPRCWFSRVLYKEDQRGVPQFAPELGRLIAGRDGIDEPVVAAIGSHSMASHLNVAGFWRCGLGRDGSHINSKLVEL